MTERERAELAEQLKRIDRLTGPQREMLLGLVWAAVPVETRAGALAMVTR